ncbi:MAG: hypothetical protein ACKVY0_10690 [Prosthecobacter sp.]|uniref:hypothetical protein n=1 Tax=Prosthecobacter sp. TaxID=1965333 RepID=UPI0038FE8115
MNIQLWQKFDQLRKLPFSGHEGLADFFRKEGIRFASKDLPTWGQFLSARFGRSGGEVHVPEWLAGVFCALAKEASPKTICDPWAGLGFLIEALREACQPEQAVAFTQNQAAHELGKVLVPDVNWHFGEPLNLIGSLPQSLDVIASILPMNARAHHPLKVTLASGEAVELTDDLGNLVMVAASQRLSSSGVGLFVVTPSFFLKQQSVFHRFSELGLGMEAALALPSGTFAPYTNIPAYLVVVRRKPSTRMFVAQLSADMNTNLQVIANFRQGTEGGSLELGRFVAADTFRSFEYLRASEAMTAAEKRFGIQASNLAELGDVKSGIKLGRPGDEFAFQPLENAIYIPMIGSSDVVESTDELTLKPQNYAQVVIDPSRSNARFVARFLNSEFGKDLREQIKTGFIPKLNKQTLRELRVFVPDLQTQRKMLEIETRITAEHNTVMALQNEIAELRRELWANPKSAPQVQERIDALARRLAGGIKQHASESLDQWFETLPFPLASILRAWQATPTQDFKTKYEHLLHFFEGTAEFVSIILLSAFNSNEAVFAPHRQKLKETMQKQNLSFNRATFGTWKLVVEYLGKQTRALLSENGKKPEDAKNDRALCADMFADPSLSLPDALSRKELAAIFSTTNKMRNDWGGHGGVVGQEDAGLRNQQLLAEVQKLREVTADTWAETQMIHALHCRPRRGVFENEVAVLMGSNNEFLKETRAMATWLDVERLYLSKKESGKALKLLPLIQVGPSPQSAKNACYFFSRLERDGARFVSYHFTDRPELTEQFADVTETVRLLSEV